MAKEPSWDEIFDAQPPMRSRADAVDTADRPVAGDEPPVGTKPGRGRLRRLRRQRDQRDDEHASPMRAVIGGLIAVAVILGLLAAGAAAVFFTFEDQVRSALGWEEPNDFEGTGSGEVIVAITEGDVGSDIAQTLSDAGVTKTSEAFYDLLLADQGLVFQPGSYALKEGMSAQSALDALLDPANRRELTSLFQEGRALDEVFETLSTETGVPLADFEAASTDLAAFGLPPEAPSLEGYLFPARYTFEQGTDAAGILQTLVNRTFQALDAAGVPAEDRHRVLTIASLIQREAGSNPDDFYKVSRVVQNRLDAGMPLQFDSTAHYGYAVRYGERLEQSVFSTAEELADDNPYNTYVISGLPLGPIGAPGDLAIDAAMNPVDGPWLYFVTVNLDTGETAFTTTGAEHEAAVAQLRAWCTQTQSPNCD